MDIIYKLHLPKEVCSKIFMYACKSPHIGLGVAILKKIIGLPIYNKLIEYEEDVGNVVKMSNFALSSIEVNQLMFDIIHLKSLPNLTAIDLSNTEVMGDIAHLKSLLNLTTIILFNTEVMGDIEHLESLPKLF